MTPVNSSGYTSVKYPADAPDRMFLTREAVIVAPCIRLIFLRLANDLLAWHEFVYPGRASI